MQQLLFKGEFFMTLCSFVIFVQNVHPLAPPPPLLAVLESCLETTKGEHAAQYGITKPLDEGPSSMRLIVFKRVS